jgi:hypothetical protein
MRRPSCLFESVHLEPAMPFEATDGLHTKVYCPVSEQPFRRLDGTCAPHGMPRSPRRPRRSHFRQNRSFRVAALPRRLHATHFNVVAESEADEAHHTSQVWWNFGGRLRWAQASCDRQDDQKMAELCTQVSCSVYVAI